MNRKRIRILGAAAAAAVLLTAGILYLRTDNSSVHDQSVWICTEGTADISDVSIYCREDDQKISFTPSGDGSWVSSDGNTYTGDQFTPYLSHLGYMKVRKQIKEGAAEEYDLADPGYTITVDYNGGQAFTYGIGTYAEGTGLYITAGGEEIYLLDEQRAKVLNSMISSVYNASLDVIVFDEARGIHLSEPGKDMITINRSESPRAGSSFYWNIFKPYAWIADTEVIEDLVDGISSIGVLKRTNSSLTEAECGLDKEEEELPSIRLFDTYDNELTLYLGDSAEEGYTYCKTNFTDGVFMIDSSIESLAALTMDDLIDPTLYYYEVPSVKTCTIDLPGVSCELSARWETGADGKRGQRFFRDGAVLSGAEYNRIAAWFTETRAEKITGSADMTGKQIGTVQLTRLSAPYEVTITFREDPEDESLIIADLGGSAAAYIQKTDLETLTGLLSGEEGETQD